MSDFSDLPMFLREYIHENRWDSFRDVQIRTFAAFKENDNHIIISSELITPREITRDLISLLDTLHQNPQVGFDDLVKGRNVKGAVDTDDDIIEDLDI